MMQVSGEAQRTEASRARLAGATDCLGFLFPAAIALFWGIICWLWLTTHTGMPQSFYTASGMIVSELTQVDGRNVTGMH